MLFATSSLVIGVSRYLRLPLNGSSSDFFGLLKCALKWSLILETALGSVTFVSALSLTRRFYRGFLLINFTASYILVLSM